MSKTDVNISFGLVDVSAKQDTTAAVTDKQDFIDPQDLSLEGVYAPKAATLEKDYWKLDGTFKTFPDSPENVTWGLWSESMSDINGDFGNPIVLTLQFANLHSSIGLTFEFNPYDNSYCNDLNIKWYKDDGLLYDVDFIPDNWRYSCINTVENYNKIIITFNSMNKPYRYLKIQSLSHGVQKYFSKNDITNAQILEEIDLTSAELSINTLDFTVHSENEEFDIFNPQGVYSLLQKKQQLAVEGIKDDELIGFGNFYVNDWNVTDNGIDISAFDAIGIMDGTTFKGGIYINKPAEELIEEIMNDAGFGYSFDVALKGTLITGWIPICSHREALKQVAFAIGAYVDTSRGGMVKIRAQASRTIDKQLSKSRKIEGTSVLLREYVSGISITEHSYTMEDNISELYKGTLSIGEKEIKFSEPAANLTITGATIIESGVNYCKVNVATEGEVIVNGKKYKDNTTVFNLSLEEIIAGEKENIKKINDATLITKENSESTAQRLLNYYCNRIEQNVGFILVSEAPGDVVNIEVNKNNWRMSVVEHMEIDLSNGFVTKAVAVGE